MAKAEKFVAFGCPHFPLQDDVAIAWLIDTIVREKPSVIAHLGDGIEANAASQWDDAKELALALADEYEAHDAFLAQIRKAAPRARLIVRAGNHESNITRAGRLDPRIRSLCDWRSPKNQPELKHWSVGGEYKYCRTSGASWITPQVCVSHGYETSKSGLDVEAFYFLKNNPFSLYVSAHTHRPRPVAEIIWKGDLPMDRWTANVGTLRDMDSATFMDRNRRWGWGQACVVGEAMPLKSPRMSKEWSAETRVFRMYDDAVKGAA